jgi:phage-related minor tail protein
MRAPFLCHFAEVKRLANNIKGITVEIGGNTGPLNQALKDVNKAARETQSELREVNKQLKFDPQNATLTRQKIDLLKNSVQELTTKQATLKDAVRQAQDQFEKGDLGAD